MHAKQVLILAALAASVIAVPLPNGGSGSSMPTTGAGTTSAGTWAGQQISGVTGSAAGNLAQNGNTNQAGNDNQNNGNGNGDCNDFGNKNVIGSNNSRRNDSPTTGSGTSCSAASVPAVPSGKAGTTTGTTGSGQDINHIWGSAVGDLSQNGQGNQAGNGNEGNGNSNGDGNIFGNSNTIGSGNKAPTASAKRQVRRASTMANYVNGIIAASATGSEGVVSAAAPSDPDTSTISGTTGSAAGNLAGNGNGNQAGNGNKNNGNDNGSNNNFGNNNTIGSNNPVRARRQEPNNGLGGALGLISPQVADSGIEDLQGLGQYGPQDLEKVAAGLKPSRRQLSGEIFDFIATDVAPVIPRA